MLDLILSATRGGWQVPAHHGTEQDAAKAMKEVRQKILDRDKGVCQFCGFKAQRWQEIHHVNDNHGDNSPSNLVTACSFCHQCMHLGLAGSTAGGELIWLPEMSQAELNHLCRAIFVAMRDEKGKLYSSAFGLYMALKNRGVFLEQNFSVGASDPGLLGQAFLKMKPEEYAARGEHMKNIKLLPQNSRFEPQIKYWAEVVFRDLGPDSWSRLVDPSKIEPLQQK